MEPVFDARLAEQLSGAALEEAREFLLNGLKQATGIPLEICGEEKTIHCTDVHTSDPKASPFTLTWEGFIGSSNYRDDGIVVYGAHLFPLIGGRRCCVLRMRAGTTSYDYAFRYLMLTPEEGWQDRGLTIDEYGEFEHWYIEPGIDEPFFGNDNRQER